jgi:hypothetical protein
MSYTLGEAARATGKSKAAISRAIKLHKLSAERRDDGSFRIDPAELHRVYPPVAAEPTTQPSTAEPGATGEVRELRARLAAAAERLADKDAVIEDLRRRLDAEAEERRRAQAQLTALLTDQRQQPAPQPAARSWWKFWRARGE